MLSRIATLVFLIGITLPIQSVFAQYCTPSYTANETGVKFIENFSIATFRHKEINDDEFNNPTYINVSDEKKIVLETNEAIYFTMDAQFSSYLGIYIDLNNDGDFEDQNETIKTVHQPRSSHTDTLKITSNVNHGQTYRLRLRMVNDWDNESIDPCDNYAEGQTIDYSVILIPSGIPYSLFTANDTTVTTIDYVHFNDASLNNPDRREWVFEGGTPNTSTEAFPKNIQFQYPGCYEISLTTFIGDQDHNLTKSCYIEVTQAPPGADFTASKYDIVTNESINFFDSSEVDAVSWKWFLDSTIQFSSMRNPSDIQFNSPGSYEISLEITDTDGNTHFRTKKDFITVNSRSSIEEHSRIKTLIYPNPVVKELTIQLTDKSTINGSLKLMNSTGQKIFSKNLRGANKQEFKFDLSSQASGLYHLIILLDQGTTTHKIQVL